MRCKNIIMTVLRHTKGSRTVSVSAQWKKPRQIYKNNEMHHVISLEYCPGLSQTQRLCSWQPMFLIPRTSPVTFPIHLNCYHPPQSSLAQLRSEWRTATSAPVALVAPGFISCPLLFLSYFLTTSESSPVPEHPFGDSGNPNCTQHSRHSHVCPAAEGFLFCSLLLSNNSKHCICLFLIDPELSGHLFTEQSVVTLVSHSYMEFIS